MSRPVPWKSWLAPALILPGAWAGLVLLFAGQFIAATDITWEESLTRAASFWIAWLFLLPLVWLFTRWLLNRQTGPLASTTAHLLACTAAVLICQAITPDLRGRPGNNNPNRPSHSLPEHQPKPRPDPFLERLPDRQPPRPNERPADRPGPPNRPTPGNPPDFSNPANEFQRSGNPPPWARNNRPPGPPPEAANRSRGPFGPLGFRSILDLMVYGTAACVTYAIGFLRRSQQRERRTLELESSLSRAQLDALRLQINPHFLFNTLNATASLIHTRPDTADDMIGSLSELLRASLQGDGNHEIPLARELELLRLFMEIEHTRFGDRIQFIEDIDAACLSGAVPSLILQPLVENAIRHGLEPTTGPGTVTITARRQENQLILTVTDNGTGFDPDLPASPPSTSGTGIGLTNTRRRLAALHGPAAALTLASAKPRGTTVTLTLPWHTV